MLSASCPFSYQVAYLPAYGFIGILHVKEIGSLTICWVVIFPTLLFVDFVDGVFLQDSRF